MPAVPPPIPVETDEDGGEGAASSRAAASPPRDGGLRPAALVMGGDRGQGEQQEGSGTPSAVGDDDDLGRGLKELLFPVESVEDQVGRQFSTPEELAARLDVPMQVRGRCGARPRARRWILSLTLTLTLTRRRRRAMRCRRVRRVRRATMRRRARR